MKEKTFKFTLKTREIENLNKTKRGRQKTLVCTKNASSKIERSLLRCPNRKAVPPGSASANRKFLLHEHKKFNNSGGYFLLLKFNPIIINL